MITNINQQYGIEKGGVVCDICIVAVLSVYEIRLYPDGLFCAFHRPVHGGQDEGDENCDKDDSI